MKTNNLKTTWQAVFTLMLTVAIIMMPDFALAQQAPPGINDNDTMMGWVLCTVAQWFTGNTGKGLAVIAVTIVGIGALMGKVSWGMAITVGIGVAIVFGAPSIVEKMGAGVDWDYSDAIC